MRLAPSLSLTLAVLTDVLGVPSSVNYAGVVEDLLRLPGVRNAHSLHIWSLSTQKVTLSVHIAIGKCACSMMMVGMW